MAELADAQDLGSCVNSCRFDPCYPHQTKNNRTSCSVVFSLVRLYRVEPLQPTRVGLLCDLLVLFLSTLCRKAWFLTPVTRSCSVVFSLARLYRVVPLWLFCFKKVNKYSFILVNIQKFRQRCSLPICVITGTKTPFGRESYKISRLLWEEQFSQNKRRDALRCLDIVNLACLNLGSSKAPTPTNDLG